MVLFNYMHCFLKYLRIMKMHEAVLINRVAFLVLPYPSFQQFIVSTLITIFLYNVSPKKSMRVINWTGINYHLF